VIVVGSVLTLAIFLFVGWAVSTEMFQHRAWRRRVESGDVDIVAALVEEALTAWKRARPAQGVSPILWSSIQGAQLISVESDSATLSASAEAEFRSEGGQRIQTASALDVAIATAAKLLDMMMYDVPNLRLGRVRVDVYSTFTSSDGAPVQQPILTTTADRSVAEELVWEGMTPAEVLGRFATTYQRSESGQPVAIVLAPLEGNPPRPAAEAAADFAREQRGPR
jgi:hypothetical protein